jgi:anti-sigma factor RsiW
MSCSSYDWKAYALGELNPAERQNAEVHAASCTSCHEELATMRVTLDALSALRDEEVPRRIAFVSDKVFEPRWWQRGLQYLSSPAFAGACVVATAIVVHAFAGTGSSDKAIQARVDAAVNQAVAQVEVRERQQTEEMVQAYELLTKQFRQVYKQTSGLVLQ